MNIYIVTIICISVFLICCIYMYTSRSTSRSPEYIIVKRDNYNITEVKNFLTSEECDRIIELSRDNLFPSRIYGDSSDLYSTSQRKSEQCWLDDNNQFIKTISDKVKNITNTHDKYHEQLQVVNYTKGGFFTTHYDACEGNKDFCKRMDGENGPRYLTVLIYLNDGFEGGETVFPKINKSVKPEKGKAVIFQNVDQDGNIIEQALHGGEPLKSGEKWIANKWIHL